MDSPELTVSNRLIAALKRKREIGSNKQKGKKIGLKALDIQKLVVYLEPF